MITADSTHYTADALWPTADGGGFGSLAPQIVVEAEVIYAVGILGGIATLLPVHAADADVVLQPRIKGGASRKPINPLTGSIHRPVLTGRIGRAA